MQPDNEKIIEALTEHQTATRKLIQNLLESGATAHTLEGIIQTLKILEICYGQQSECCIHSGMGAIGAISLRRQRTNVEDGESLEKIITEAIRQHEERESNSEADS